MTSLILFREIWAAHPYGVHDALSFIQQTVVGKCAFDRHEAKSCGIASSSEKMNHFKPSLDLIRNSIGLKLK